LLHIEICILLVFLSFIGKELGLDAQRTYLIYKEMVRRESKLPQGEKVDFIVITKPNHWHYPMGRDFLKAGFHVLCEKPMTLNVKEARDLERQVEKTRQTGAGFPEGERRTALDAVHTNHP